MHNGNTHCCGSDVNSQYSVVCYLDVLSSTTCEPFDGSFWFIHLQDLHGNLSGFSVFVYRLVSARIVRYSVVGRDGQLCLPGSSVFCCQ